MPVTNASRPQLNRRRGSTVHLDEWVTPGFADEGGYLRAGKVLEWMDVVASVAAARHCRLPVVTASVDGMVMRDPARIGERVTLTAALGHTSERSIGVSIATKHGPLGADAARHVVDAYIVFRCSRGQGRGREGCLGSCRKHPSPARPDELAVEGSRRDRSAAAHPHISTRADHVGGKRGSEGIEAGAARCPPIVRRTRSAMGTEARFGAAPDRGCCRRGGRTLPRRSCLDPANSPGCTHAAMISKDSAMRGPGRLKNAFPSAR
jgi:acyl-CoA hydrolase